jgi:hypothetical protein
MRSLNARFAAGFKKALQTLVSKAFDHSCQF